ncbi:unnamed protein product, partial [Auanema sp. JU1783]
STLDILETSSNSALISALNTPERLTEKLCDKDAELAKISCLSSSDNEKLYDGFLKYRLASAFNELLFTKALSLIGMEELRKTLNLPPPPPWTSYNYTKPSEEELASAPTLEAYFNLRVPKPKIFSLDSFYYYEHNFLKVIPFLDEHAPVIRAVIRCKFEMMRSLDDKGLTERQRIDRMIAELSTIQDKLKPAIERMFGMDCYEENESQT